MPKCPQHQSGLVQLLHWTTLFRWTPWPLFRRFVLYYFSFIVQFLEYFQEVNSAIGCFASFPVLPHWTFQLIHFIAIFSDSTQLSKLHKRTWEIFSASHLKEHCVWFSVSLQSHSSFCSCYLYLLVQNPNIGRLFCLLDGSVSFPNASVSKCDGSSFWQPLGSARQPNPIPAPESIFCL